MKLSKSRIAACLVLCMIAAAVPACGREKTESSSAAAATASAAVSAETVQAASAEETAAVSAASQDVSAESASSQEAEVTPEPLQAEAVPVGAQEASGRTNSDTKQGVEKVVTRNIRLRSSSNSNSLSNIITTVRKGSVIEVLGRERNGWYRVRYNGQTGYMNIGVYMATPTADNVIVYDDEGTAQTAAAGDDSSSAESTDILAEDTETGDWHKVTANVRFRSSMDSEIRSNLLGTIPKGSSVMLLSTQDGWARVRYRGAVGYVKAEYIR